MKIELCTASVEALYEAKTLGVDRVELCACLEQGGLTPSMGFIGLGLDLGLNCHVLIRPRAGGFVYSEQELSLIRREIDRLKHTEVHGIVFGALDGKNQVDRSVMIDIRNRWYKEITFHRAFDDLSAWESELTGLMDIGINRILSSGLSRSVETGIPILEKMTDLAKGRIEIMAGGGVNLSNVSKIREKVAPDAIHFSATTKHSLDESSLFSEVQLRFDAAKATKLVEACRNFR